MVIRMVVIEPYTMVRQGIIELLADDLDIEIVGEAGNGIEAMTVVKEMQPDVVLIDLDVPGLDSYVTGRLIELGNPGMQVFAYSVSSLRDIAPDSIPRKISGYVAKSASAADLIMQIKVGSDQMPREPGKPQDPGAHSQPATKFWDWN